MGILDNLDPPERQSRCVIAKTKLILSDEDKKLFEEAVNNDKWPASQLSIELGNRGIRVSRFALMDHRKKVCECSRI